MGYKSQGSSNTFTESYLEDIYQKRLALQKCIVGNNDILPVELSLLIISHDPFFIIVIGDQLFHQQPE